MKHNQIIEQNQNVIKIRQEFIWNYVFVYLENIKGTKVMDDRGFKSRYDELLHYVASQCDMHIGGDITDIYVVIEKVNQLSDKKVDS